MLSGRPHILINFKNLLKICLFRIQSVYLYPKNTTLYFSENK